MKKYLILFISFLFCFKIFAQSDVQKITVAPGPEDFVLVGERLIISCAERRKENEFQSGFWSLNLETNQLDKFEINLLNNRKFSPHGISYLKEDKLEYLFVVNHVSKNVSEIVCFKLEKNTLKELKSFQNKTIKHPNSVVAVSLKEFYITNSIPFTGNVVHFKDSTYTVIAKGLSYANGLLIMEGGLYVAPTLGNKLLLLTPKNGGFIKEKITHLKGPDNIRPYKEGTLLVVGHTNISKFISHVKNKEKRSPFIVYSVDLKNNKVKTLYENDGSVLSGGSTGIIYKNYLYIAQVFEDFILKIKLKQ